MMSRIVRPLCWLIPFVALATAPVRADFIIAQNGPHDGWNMIPFSQDDPGRYQQVYESSLFTSQVSISSIAFSTDQPTTYSANITVRFTTTSKAVGALSSSLDSNFVMPLTATFVDPSFSQALVPGGSEAFGLVFDFSSTPIVYEPADGNLLMDILISDQILTPLQFPAFTGFSQVSGGTIYSRAWDTVVRGQDSDAAGLRTKFEFEELLFPPQPPTADAGPDQLVTVAPGQSAMVTLDGSGSSDSNSDLLTFTWTNSFDGVVLPDQEQPLFDFTNVGAVGIGGNSQQKLDQVITTGISGPLVEVTMPIVLAAGNLRISVTDTIADAPGNTILASVVVAAGDLPASFPTGVVFSSIVFDTPAFFSVGDQFSIVLECEGSPGSCQGAYVQGPVGDPYPGGNGWFDSRPNQVGVWVPIGSRADLPFQTFVLGSAAGPAMGERPTVTLAPGVHTITLTVDDGNGGTDSDTVEITVNQPPTADAGPDQHVTVAPGDTAMVTLDGSGSSDPDDDPLTFT
jgi:hypothetical protein